MPTGEIFLYLAMSMGSVFLITMILAGTAEMAGLNRRD